MNNDQWTWFGDSVLSKGQETQLRIIKTAIALFSEAGFSAVTLQKIAKGSKTSHPLILKHFGDKERLLLAIRKYVSFRNHQWVDSRIKPSMSGEECIVTHLIENIHWGYANPAEAKIVLLTYYYSSLTEGGLGAFRLGNERIHRYVLQAEREGAVNGDASLPIVTEMLHEYGVGLFIKMLATDPKNKQRLPGSYKKKVGLMVHAILGVEP